MNESIQTASSLLWNIVSIIGSIILLWALWQIVQVVRNLREYGLDYIGFLRGELHRVADKHKITVLRPSQARIHTILFQERIKEFEDNKERNEK